MDVDSPPKASKRKQPKDDDDSGSDGGSDVEMLDVEFDFFDPQPHDYHSIKLLLAQLLSHDAKNLELEGVVNLVLEQKLVGSTVKTDGAEGDPYAVLTVLNLNVHKDNPSIASLLAYLLTKAAPSPSLHAKLKSLFDLSAADPKHVGLVLSERLVNMPPQVVPPMYRMLEEELGWARDDKEPYHFSHLLFLSRVFLSSSSSLEEDPNAALNADESEGKQGGKGKKSKGGKKKKKTGEHAGEADKAKEQVWMYHPEDEYIARFAAETHVFAYSSAAGAEGGREADSFGVDIKGQMMLLEWGKFSEVVAGLEGFLGGME